jgi:hypothetical protein
MRKLLALIAAAAITVPLAPTAANGGCQGGRCTARSSGPAARPLRATGRAVRWIVMPRRR